MKIGIMQPYFFPYLGYFSLIKHTDRFILFDTVQFIRHGWIERNRILKPHNGWQYISVPLENASQHLLIQDIKIKETDNWKEKLFAQLAHYKKKSPYYNSTLDVMKSALNCNHQNITELNHHILQTVCSYLDIAYRGQIFSQMGLEIEQATAPDEWALNICKELRTVTEYWNPEGGATFFNKIKYEKAGIKLIFLKPKLNFYSQRRGVENFTNGLSIIDVMMFNSPERINEMLNEYECI